MTKNPLILPSKHRAVQLYIKYQLKVFHHEGVEYIRLPSDQLNTIVYSVDCLQASIKPPQMSDLPIDRVMNNVRPFTNTVVGYFGSFEVRVFRGTVKKWLCLFTCLSVRAVHLELVESLDTASCIDAVHRFIARRCQPKAIFSDNDTTFVGAAREFKKCFTELQRHEITVKLSESGIKCSFNLPAAPHFSGVWERLVRSCKKALFNVLGKQSLKKDRLQTVLGIVEQLINNRPLADVSSDVSDIQHLTQNHFLIGQINVNWPKALFSVTPVSYRKLFHDQHSILVAVWNQWWTSIFLRCNSGTNGHRRN